MNIISQMETIWPGWTVEERIGAGSYGQVYRVSRTVGNRKYYSAVKVITIPQNETEVKDVFAEEGSHSETVAHFREAVEECTREISMMIDLRGTANVVKVEDFRVIEYKDQIRWDIFIRMEYLTCLTDVIIRKRLSEEEAVKLGIDICSALELCEKKKIIHRDIKPGNIFVSEQGVYKLGDFGIARKLDSASGSLSSRETYDYMAPEMIRGQHYGASVDLYALGIVLYKLMNRNRDPFLDPYAQRISPEDRERAITRRINGENLPAPCDASVSMSIAILKACRADPESRFHTPGEMKARLSNCLRKSKDKVPESTGQSSYVSGKGQCNKNTSDAEASATAAINPYRQNQTYERRNSMISNEYRDNPLNETSQNSANSMPDSRISRGGQKEFSGQSGAKGKDHSWRRMIPVALGGVLLFAMLALVFTVFRMNSGVERTVTRNTKLPSSGKEKHAPVITVTPSPTPVPTQIPTPSPTPVLTQTPIQTSVTTPTPSPEPTVTNQKPTETTPAKNQETTETTPAKNQETTETTPATNQEPTETTPATNQEPTETTPAKNQETTETEPATTPAQTPSAETLKVYKEFIKSHSDAKSYLVYDIDKDGFPELFFEYLAVEERGFVYDIYSYHDGEFIYLDREFGVGGHNTPIFASYPDGSGILESSPNKGKELIELHNWVNGEHTETTVYLEDVPVKYYLDTSDKAFEDSLNHTSFINHQFYKGENYSPFYEGSCLLAQSEIGDYTALYEAFNTAPEENTEENAEENTEVDLYDYRYANVFELVDMIGGMQAVAGEGYIYGNSVVTVAAFSKDLSVEETNYFVIDKDEGYIFCGISIGDSREEAEGKIAALGYTLYKKGSAGSESWNDYSSGTEQIGLRFDKNGTVTRISWAETANRES